MEVFSSVSCGLEDFMESILHCKIIVMFFELGKPRENLTWIVVLVFTEVIIWALQSTIKLSIDVTNLRLFFHIVIIVIWMNILDTWIDTKQ